MKSGYEDILALAAGAQGAGLTGAVTGTGLRFIAPATTHQYVLRIWDSHNNSTMACTAHLTDGSVGDVTMTPSSAGTGVTLEEVQTITYTAGTSNAELVVSCVLTATLSGTIVIKWYAEVLGNT